MIITGCQRSGTMTVADILGIQHEVQFTPYIDYHNLSSTFLTLKSEASWMAAPFIKELAGKTKIIHLVRHPLKVINSLIGIKFWNLDVHKIYRTFLQKFCPDTTGTNPIEQSLIYWYKWNKKISDLNIPRIRLEDIMNKPQLNQRQRANIYSWTAISNSLYKTRVQGLARDYGYV